MKKLGILVDKKPDTCFECSEYKKCVKSVGVLRPLKTIRKERYECPLIMLPAQVPMKVEISAELAANTIRTWLTQDE